MSQGIVGSAHLEGAPERHDDPTPAGPYSYQVIFNAFKRIAAPYSEAEKTALFSKTATEFYQLKLG